MSRYLFHVSLALLFSFLFSCQKEVSLENGQRSKGSLQGSLGDCLPKTVKGIYKATQSIVDSNYIEVNLDVTQTGSYTVFTDTVNGYWFRGTGNFNSTGSFTVRLPGFGTPAAEGLDNFTVYFDSSFCTVPITVSPSGSSSGGTSVFTLEGSPNSCMNATPAGIYTQGLALTSANKVDIKVNVTTLGTWSISTSTVTGFSFAGSGNFTNLGVQTISLVASGTPATIGPQTFSLTAGSSSCTFIINVVSNNAPAAVFTLQGSPNSCSSATPAGTFTQGISLTVVNTVTIQVNVTTVGTWTITTNTVGGMTFSGIGTFPNTGVQPITLNGTGTPSASGAQTFTVTAGSSSCTFVITVIPSTTSGDYFPRTVNSNWSYEFDNDPNDSLLQKVISQTLIASGNTYNIFMATDDVSLGFDTSGYYRKSSGDYYEFINAGDYLGFDNPSWLEFIFLKDNQAAGFSWTTPTFNGTIQGTPIAIRQKFTILQKDVSVTVKGVSYPNTIIVEQRAEQYNGISWTDISAVVGVIKNYYAKGVGLIKQEFTDASGTILAELRRSQIN